MKSHKKWRSLNVVTLTQTNKEIKLTLDEEPPAWRTILHAQQTTPRRTHCARHSVVPISAEPNETTSGINKLGFRDNNEEQKSNGRLCDGRCCTNTWNRQMRTSKTRREREASNEKLSGRGMPGGVNLKAASAQHLLIWVGRRTKSYPDTEQKE